MVNWTQRRLVRLLAVLAVMALVAGACGGDDAGDEEAPSTTTQGGTTSDGAADDTAADGSETTGPVAETTEPSTLPEFELDMGIVQPITGSAGVFGSSYVVVGEFAIDYINEQLAEMGIDDKISVRHVGTEDDQSEGRAGVEAATKLQVEGTEVLVGGLTSEVTLAIAESVTIPNGLLQISHASTSSAVTFLDDDGLVFRTAPSDTLASQAVVALIAQEMGSDATVNIGVRNDAFGSGFLDLFVAEWEDQGGTIGAAVRWDPEAATFDSEAAELVAGDPDAWVIIEFPETWARMGPALVRTGAWDPARTFNTNGLRADTLAEELGPEVTEGLRGVSPAPAGESFDAFRAEFDARAGDTEYYAFAPLMFDAVMVPFLAAVAAGSDDPSLIKEEMQAVSAPPGTVYTFEELDAAVQALLNGEDIDFDGSSGPIDFDDAGDPSGITYEVWQFVDGSIDVVGSVELG